MGIGDEQLTKVLVIDKVKQLPYAIIIQFVKNVIQQQNGFHFGLFLNEVKLGQFQGNQKGFLLPLGAYLFDRVLVNLKYQVISMNS